jgi:hypothetical protein
VAESIAYCNSKVQMAKKTLDALEIFLKAKLSQEINSSNIFEILDKKFSEDETNIVELKRQNQWLEESLEMAKVLFLFI